MPAPPPPDVTRRIDLHVHSTASDGEHAPADVVARARAAGVDVIALTDHDTTGGVQEAMAAGEVAGVRVVCGCEFSVRAPWGELHLLGYFLPLEHPDLDDFLADQRGARAARMEEILRRLRAAGVPLTRTDVERVADGGALGRPHAARAIVERGLAAGLQEAFDRWLGRGRPAYVPKRLPPLTDVTALVHRLGGITSAAHLRDRGDRRTLAALQNAGVDAAEARHPSHDQATAARIERGADALGMLLTGGSDWHGDGRAGDPHRGPMGCVEIPPAWLTALEACHRERIPAEVRS